MTGIIATLNDIATTWGTLMWQASWQGGIALLLALLACRCLREGSASLKCWLWRLAFCKLLIAGLWFGPIPLRLLPTPRTTPPESSAAIQFAVNTKESMARFDGGESWSPAVLPSISAGPSFHASPERVERIEPIVWLLLAWSVGVAICFANLVKHWIRLRRMLARCSPLVNGPAVDCLVECCRRMHLRRRPRLFMSDGVEGPFLVGMFRPAIVLPAIVARETSGNGLPVALFHELAHIKRHDLWWNWLFALAEGLFFFHPLVWWAKREWCVAREIAADECAIRDSRMSAARYGQSLLELVARFPARRRSACLTIGVSEAYSQLSRRMMAMKTFQKASGRRRIGLAAALVGVAVVGLVPWKLAAREPVVATKPDGAKEDRSVADRGDDYHAGASRTVRGVVKDESGEPVSGATILVELFRGTDPQQQVLQTDDEGRFEIPFIDNEYRIIIVYKDGMSLASHLFRPSVGYAQVQNNAPAQPLQANGKLNKGVPSVVGLKYTEAATVLGRRGYRTIHVVPTRTACKPAMKHIVKEQSPQPGAEVDPTQPIQLILYATQEDIDIYEGKIEGPTITIRPKSKVDARKSRESTKIPSNDEESGRSIVIHVVDEEGKPIKGAEIFRNHVYRPKGSEKHEIENEHYQTDADGTAVVSLSGESVDLRLWVRKTGFVPLHAMWAKQFQSDGDQIPKEFTFRLQPGTEIGGVVRDEMGRPIPGVEVAVQNMTAIIPVSINGKPGPRPVPVHWLAERDSVALTDAQGRWTLGNVPPDEDLQWDPDLRIGHWEGYSEKENKRLASQKLAVYFRHPDYASDEEQGGIRQNDIQRSQNIMLEDLRKGTAVAVMTRLNR